MPTTRCSRTSRALDPDVLQLHGGESSERVAEVGARFGRLTMKAIGVAAPEDLNAAAAYEGPPTSC